MKSLPHAAPLPRANWLMASSSLLFWIMVLLPIPLCGSFAWLLLTQRGVQERANEQLTSLQYAVADMTEGLAQIYMAGSNSAFFERRRGLMLLRQAADEMDRSVMLLRADPQQWAQDAANSLGNDLGNFRQVLAGMKADNAESQATQALLRIATYSVQQQAARLSALVRGELTKQFDRLQYQLYVAIGISLLLLALMGWLLRMSSQARAAAYEQNQRVGDALRESDKRFRALLESATENVWIADARIQNFHFEPPHKDHDGKPKADWSAREWMQEVHPDDRAALLKKVSASYIGKSKLRLDYRIRDGENWRWLHARGAPVLDAEGRIVEWLGLTIDSTERRLLEEQLRQAQKLEVVGHLTGGIAHDFNNLLAIILGNLEFLDEVLTDPAQREMVAAAMRATERGSDLTHHLLAYARRQSLQPHVVDLRAYLPGLANLLQRALGDRITVTLNCRGLPSPVMVDMGQLETALLNLAVNARDAIEGAGAVTITLDHVSGAEIAAATARTGQIGADAPPQPDRKYVLLTLADSGSGIPPELLARVFDPFFTTKQVGKGSGLGLSMVHGFVRQSNGYIGIESSLGEGTRVKIYLPLADVDADAVPAESPPPKPAIAGKRRLTVLLVEDNPEVAKVVQHMLTELGHEPIHAATAEDALAMFDAGRHFDLLLTDIQLPGRLDGVDLVEAAERRGLLPAAIFMSGWEAPDASSKRLSGRPHPFLHKPVRKHDLAAAIEEALPAGQPA